MADLQDQIRAAIRTVADFPKPGILFKDISTLFLDPHLCKRVVTAMAAQIAPTQPAAIAGVESRGFLLGSALAMELGVPFVTIRKAGKLPAATFAAAYSLEYGTATLEMHCDAITSGQRIWIHDDVLATGGTALAAKQLIELAGGEPLGGIFLMDLTFLNGAARLKSAGLPTVSLLGV